MLATLWMVLTYPFSFLRLRHDLALEVQALRYQLMVLERQTRRPRLRRSDRCFWLLLIRLWPNWRNPLIILQPETLIGWQRAGFRIFWRWKSRRRLGRPEKDQELIELIRDELPRLGLTASTATIRKYRPKFRGKPSQGWKTFLQNHAGSIAAMDFFVVPTVTFRLLYMLILMHHDRRKVLHFNITDSPSASWTAQQIVNGSPMTPRPSICCGTAIRFTGRSSCTV